MKLRLLDWIKVGGRETQSLKTKAAAAHWRGGWESKSSPVKFNQYGCRGSRQYDPKVASWDSLHLQSRSVYGVT
jgi:hypothetical protein